MQVWEQVAQMFVNKCGCMRRTPNWVRMDSITRVWGWEGESLLGLLLHSDFESSPSWGEGGWHLPEPCQPGDGPLNTWQDSRPWEERERRALFTWRGCRMVLSPSRQAEEGGRSTPPPLLLQKVRGCLEDGQSSILPHAPGALGEHSACPPRERTDLAV